MTKAKLVLGIAVGLLVVLLAGGFCGASGKSDAVRALQTSELRGDLRGGHAAHLAAPRGSRRGDSLRGLSPHEHGRVQRTDESLAPLRPRVIPSSSDRIR